MITKQGQGKTVLDAVNYYRAECAPCHEWHDAIVFCEKLGYGFSIAGKCKNEVCTIEEFNQCVKEMSEFKGVDKYIDYTSYFSEFLSKENSDYSYYEGDEVSEEKPVYTQAMKDAGELPSVGMVAKCSVSDVPIAPISTGEVKYISKDVIIIDDSNCRNEISFYIDNCSIEPIDTRTPEQKQIDELLVTYQEHADKDVLTVLFEIMQENGHLDEVK